MRLFKQLLTFLKITNYNKRRSKRVGKNDDGENYVTYSVYKSKEEAEEDGKRYGYITSAKVEWEEDL